jgi:hypothetical protein
MNQGTIILLLEIAAALYSYSPYTVAEPDRSSDLDLLPKFLINDNEDITNINKPSSRSITKTKKHRSSNNVFWIDQIITYTDWNSKDDLILSISDSDNQSWSGLTRLNGRGQYSLTPTTMIKYNSLLNLITDGNGFQPSNDLRLDLEELYLSWNAFQNTHLDIGRINIRNGVASGFNPTDYFRTHSVVTRTTEDVNQLKDSRLGTLAFYAQQVSDGRTLNFAISPDVGNKSDRWYTDHDIYGLHLNNTNNLSRYLISFAHELVDGLSPEFFFMNESGRNNYGLNFSYALNDRSIFLFEINTGKRLSLIEESLYSTEDNTFVHPTLRSSFPNSGEKYFTQSATGISYTTNHRITTIFEYHYNQAGLGEDDWKVLFKLADSNHGNEAIIGPLASTKRLARSRIEPLSKHTLMARTAWTDFIHDLSANLLIYFDLIDRSNMTQFELLWNYNQQTSLTARFSQFSGDDKSNFGSMNHKITAFFQIDFYF